MSYQPHTVIGACPECGSTPEPKIVGIFKPRTRMECRCGVSGAWQEYTGRDPWHDAVRGWHGLPVNLGPKPGPHR